ncbi:MAG: acyl-CoA/acyl-ACP dehydrogenase, partial [Acidimicrobiia bacterium]|jgi:(2S)-methylsuccinyl-CoA dehydrogenase|nr:acyl-CoA/acyl-ACP dehydrogenase [Acidimicrobiia bacterium]
MTFDLAASTAAVETAESFIEKATAKLAEYSVIDGRMSVKDLDKHQVFAYDLAHAAAGVAGCRSMLRYGTYGEFEANLAGFYIAETIADLVSRIIGRESEWGVSAEELSPAAALVEHYRSNDFIESFYPEVIAKKGGDAHLDDSFELVQDTFRRFGEDKIKPHAEHVHRTNGDVPQEIIDGLAEIGGFGLSVPEEYGGFADGSENDYMGMVVATEELARASLCLGGSLITRPEILTRALVKGGTEEQKQHWLPQIAAAEVLSAVAVTEPDYGSDVAGVKVTATPAEGGYVINGVKTWCTFAGRANVLMVLARTDPDRSSGHKGLSILLVEKPVQDGHAFEFAQDGGGKMEGRAIDTIGYRGMHSYEVAFDNWFVPADNLVGGTDGLGRGFYLQMEGFENGRLQTAARAVGVMQAAFESAVEYGDNRIVFGLPVSGYQLTKAKIIRMAALIQAGRQFAYDVARMMASGEGLLEASMVKAYVCRTSEWVTREAMQIHGGMGYAEEYDVSRYFVDARVLSIFEGADETLCLRVIARRLADRVK